MPTLFHNKNEEDRSSRWFIEDERNIWHLFNYSEGFYDLDNVNWTEGPYVVPTEWGYDASAYLTCQEANALCARFHINADEKDLEAWIRENHPAGFQTDKTITVETEPSAGVTITGGPNLLASLGLRAERIPRFGETCDEITATLVPHSREMRVLILETLLRIESGEVKT